MIAPCLLLTGKELLEFANPVYGESEAAGRVLMTDLEVVVTNMLNGPAGLLRDARFFADNRALMAMDKLEAKGQTLGRSAASLFPTSPGASPAEWEQPAMGGIKMPEMPGGGIKMPEMPGGIKLPWQ